MISAEFFYNRDHRIQGFTIQGHAGYAEYGSDIVCSAVSALAINAMNSIETLVKIPIEYEESEDGHLSCSISDFDNPDAQLLLQSLLLGLQSIQESYGTQYLNIANRNL